MKTHYLILIAILFFGCKKDKNEETSQPENYSITGVAQKGPYPQGSKVTVYELNDNLEQTGKVFKTTTTDDYGSFELKDMLLSSSKAQVEVEGTPFNEVTGGYDFNNNILPSFSDETITLSNIADLKKSSTVNINLLSDLASLRLKNLVKTGVAFDNARIQAEKEVMAVFGLDSLYSVASDKMDISQTEVESGLLLTMSVILIKSCFPPNAIPLIQLPQCIAKLRTDLENDGITSDTIFLNSFKRAIAALDADGIRALLSAFYKKEIPSFTKYLDMATRKMYAVSEPGCSASNITIPSVAGNVIALPLDTNYLADSAGVIKFTLPSDGKKHMRLTISSAGDIRSLSANFSGWGYLSIVGDIRTKMMYELQGTGLSVDIPFNVFHNSLICFKLEDITQYPFKTVVKKWVGFKNK